MAKIVTGVALVAGVVALDVLLPGAVITPFGWTVISAGISMTIGGIADQFHGANPTISAVHQAAQSRVTIYGQTRVSPVIAYESTTGHQLNQVLLWASHPCQSIDVIYVGGKEIHINDDGSGTGGPGNGQTYTDPSGNKYSFGSELGYWNSLGLTTGHWFSQLNAQNSAYWDSSCTLNGIAATYLKTTADSGKFSGIPTAKAAIHGKCDIYDPRTHTYGWTANAALIISDFLCNRDFGVGCDYATEIDETQLIAAANLCDESVTLAGGGTVRRYEINGTFDWSSAPGDTLEQLLQACEGRISYTGGKWKIFPAAWYGTSLAYDQNDYISTVQWQVNRKLRDRFNAVRATYVCPVYPYAQYGYDRNHPNNNIWNGQYQLADMPEYAQDPYHGYTSDVNLAADGNNKLYSDRSYKFVTCCNAAQRLSKIFLMRNRQQGSATLEMNLSALQAQAQDVVQMSFPALGWSSKYVEIQKISTRVKSGSENDKSQNISCQVEVVDTDPSVYSWSVAEERNVEDTMEPVRADGLSVNPPTAVTLESATSAVVGVDGVVSPRIHVTWTQADDPFVTSGGHIEVQWQLVGGSWVTAPSLSGVAVDCYIPGVVSGNQYNVQLRSKRASGAYSGWVVAGPHTVSIQRSVLSGNDVFYPNGNSATYLQPSTPNADNTAQAGSILIQNPNFLAPDPGSNPGWTPSGNAGLVSVSHTGWLNSTGVGQITPAAGTSAIINKQQIPVAQGNVISAACYVQGTGTANGTSTGVVVMFYTSGGLWLATNVGNAPTTGTGWNQSKVVATAPASAGYALIGFQTINMTTGQWQFGGFSGTFYPSVLDEVPDGPGYRKVSAPHVQAGTGHITYSSGTLIDALVPAQAGADATNQQSIVYSGTTENIIPNGDFLLGNIQGWFECETYGAYAPAAFNYNDWGGGVKGIWLGGGSYTAVGSQTFGVIPGQRYKVSFSAFAGTGTQAIYLRLNLAASYSYPLVRTTYYDFMAAGGVTNNSSNCTYTYDWVCPAGINYASAAVYQWNGTSAVGIRNVSCVPYGNVGTSLLGGSSTPLNGQGSIIPNQSFGVTYTAAATTITINWTAMSLLRADGSYQVVNAGSKVYSSLSPSTHYYFYPYVDVAGQTIGFANSTPPSTTGSAVSLAVSQQDGRVPFAINGASESSAYTITTCVSGGQPVGGTGGGGDTCPEAEELVEEQTKGLIKAKDVVLEDMLKGKCFATGEDVYRKVVCLRSAPAAIWRVVDGHKVSPCEPLWHEGAWKPAYQATGSTIDYSNGMRIYISLDNDQYDEQNYYLTEGTPLLIHNSQPRMSPC